MQRRSLACGIALLALVSGAARGAERYRFRISSEPPPMGAVPGGVVVADGARYMVHLDSPADGQPTTHDAVLKTSADARELALDSEDRTYFNAPPPPTPDPDSLSLLRMPSAKAKVKQRLFQCSTESSDTSFAGQPVSILRLLVGYDLELSLPGGGSVAGALDVDAEFRFAPAVHVAMPTMLRPHLRTGQPAIDARIAECERALTGFNTGQDVIISRHIVGGVVDRFRRRVTVESLEAVEPASGASFQIPSGFRYQEPVMSAPGVLSHAPPG